MKKRLLPLLTLAASSQLMATNGYFDHGYGIKAKGMGGAGIAFAQDALAPATNPAGAALIPDSVEVGVSLFRPDRGATPLGGGYLEANGKASFVIPDFGFRTAISPSLAFDLAIFGNGGMNTTYSVPVFDQNPAVAASNLTMNLEQAFVAPTLAWKSGDHAVGASLILAHQRFKATGLEEFGVANQGTDTALGAGTRLGYTGKVNDWLTVGATYQTRIYNGRFDKYAGLFAEQGDFDVPSNFGVGLAAQAAKDLTVALDVSRIRYSEIAAVGNPNTAFAGGVLGSDNGPGFGWKDITVYKLGLAYVASPRLTLRAGYNHNTQPIPGGETTFNAIAPGVVQDHATLGFTWKLSQTVELSGFYARAFEETVRGNGTPTGGFDLRMDQDSVGLSLNWLL
jgi:long-chain fatty acid transport protein